jgi:hypothetical protein
MKRIAGIALIALAGVLSAGNALAQDVGVRARVPFDFTVGNRLLPSGTYTITYAAPGVVWIQDRDKHISTASTTISDSREPKHGGELVFNKYGDQYFLSEVLCPAGGMSVSLPQSKQEKRVRLQEAMVHNSDQVFLALK